MSAVAAPDGSSGFAVYVHVPFCVRRCTYCDFPIVVGLSAAARSRYLDAVVAEWTRETLPPGPITSVYFGGGTPSLADPRDIGRVLEALAARAAIRLGAEVTLEANPATVTANRLVDYHAAGINRVSLGVQAAQSHHLRRLHREHDVVDAHRAVRQLRRARFDNVSVDAIYGLPDQTLAEWRETIRCLTSWEPEHVSLYALQVEEGTPLARSVGRGAAALPGEDVVGDMADLAEAVLPAMGYRRYELSNFSRPGRESRHNRAYWRHHPYIGVGAGAHSFEIGLAGARRWWNGRHVRRYVTETLEGGDPTVGEERLSWAQLAGEAVWLGLRERGGVSLPAFRERFGISLDQAFPGVLGPLVDGHLIHRTPDTIHLTGRGMALGNQVFSRFLTAVLPPPGAAEVAGAETR